MRARHNPRKPALSRLDSVCRASVALRGASDVLGAAAEASRLALAALEAELSPGLSCRARLMTPGVRAAALRGGCCYLVLSFAASGETALLELEDGFAAALAERLAGGEGGPSCPGPLSDAEAAAVCFLGLCALRAISEVSLLEQALAVRLVRLARSDREVAPELTGCLVAIDLALALGPVRGGGRLLLPGAAVDRLVARHPCIAGPLPPEFLAASLPTQLIAAGTGLAATELHALRPGDVLRLDALRAAPPGVAGPARLAAEGFQLRGRLDGRAFSVASLDVATPLEVPMDVLLTPPPLPIQIEVELTRIRIPLSELARLQPGAVVPLDIDLTDPVLLRVGDRAIARAELVDLEGELGARIVSLLS